jgi:chemotaxis protein CheD
VNIRSAADPRRIQLPPGGCHVTRSPLVLSTLLGSCVAVCLYDPQRRVAGMNHFVLPARRAGGGADGGRSDDGRYGPEAMNLLIRGLLQLGAERRRLCAKAFGGAHLFGRDCKNDDGPPCVGRSNEAFLRAFLEREGIALVSGDLGGDYGRQMHFDAADFSVYVRRISTLRMVNNEAHKRAYWSLALDDKDEGAPRTDIR